MLKVLVSFMLGPWGLKVLNFYLEHDAIINSIVFIYGIFLMVAHLNYRKISEQVFMQVPALSSKKSKQKTIIVDIPKAIEDKKMFPFIIGQVSLIPKKTSPEAVKSYLVKDKRWIEVVGERKVEFME